LHKNRAVISDEGMGTVFKKKTCCNTLTSETYWHQVCERARHIPKENCTRVKTTVRESTNAKKFLDKNTYYEITYYIYEKRPKKYLFDVRPRFLTKKYIA